MSDGPTEINRVNNYKVRSYRDLIVVTNSMYYEGN